MEGHSNFFNDINLILAADHRLGKINPDDDQVWEIDTSSGEPPALAFRTTYGLRAMGMRLFPRFSINHYSIIDPRTFSTRPVLTFAAPNFLTLQFSPFNTIDVQLKIWVPDSHSLVGQVTLTNLTSQLLKMEMEWVAQLSPLVVGTPMTSTQISVNTVLQGQTGNLFPVFFLTGGPRGDFSAFPSLGVEVSLPPNASRQFSWALSSMNSVEASFYESRKSTAWSLDNEHLKILMMKRQQTLSFDSDKSSLGTYLEQSQDRAFQLILPPVGNLIGARYMTDRNPDRGSTTRGRPGSQTIIEEIQCLSEIFELSRMLIPNRTDLVIEMLQNFLDQQGMDGTIYSQLGRAGKVTSFAAFPLLSSLILDVFNFTDDKDWLKQSYPALIRAIKIWFSPKYDLDEDGWPEWQHLLQTGFLESPYVDINSKFTWDTLVKTAEWPSLAALLWRECQNLKKIAQLIDEVSDLDWLELHITQLDRFLDEAWSEKLGFLPLRDRLSHGSLQGVRLHTFRQNGTKGIGKMFTYPSRLCIRVRSAAGQAIPIECDIRGVVNAHEKVVKVAARQFKWVDGDALAVSEQGFSRVDDISISGIKKGDSVIIESPNFTSRTPDFLIPLWTGCLSDERAKKLIQGSLDYMESIPKSFPLYLKIMWLEGLNRYGFSELACRFFQRWYMVEDSALISQSERSVRMNKNVNIPTASLHQLIPIKTLLELLGVKEITPGELLISRFNEFLPKVNVQYKKFLLTLASDQTRIMSLNGNSVVIKEPGVHRIELA